MGVGGLDLFAAASAEGAWTVGEVTRRARAVVEAGLPPLWVRGEVSGFKRWQSGHWYFALRDRTAQLRCVMFARDNRRLPAAPADGMQVFAFGRPTVWEEKGELRLTVLELLSTEAGGLWQLAFERAKAALAKDGLLDPARKRRLPGYAQRIAGLDVVIVGRGGGSKEDLWTFNSERVARAVAAVPVPVISAVGHETDVTLCDLVADYRAPTPSAAAAAATPDRADVLDHLTHLGARLGRAVAGRVDLAGQRVERSLDRLAGAMTLRVERHHHRLSALSGRLDALSPLKILERGYALARDAEGRLLKRVAQFAPGLGFRLRVSDGDVPARVAGS